MKKYNLKQELKQSFKHEIVIVIKMEMQHGMD